jgi:hypothetical protein
MPRPIKVDSGAGRWQGIVPRVFEPPPFESSSSRPVSPSFGRVIGTRNTEPPPDEPEPDPETAKRWLWLAVGFGAAFLAGFVLPHNFTWFLCALPHEMGHATIGCLLGHPSAPAISLQGHAWTGVGELRTWLVWVMAIGFATGAGVLRRTLPACIPLAVMAVLIPLVAFTKAADVLISVGGHAGELAFATWCYTMAWTGGRTDTPQERGACAMAGGLVQFANLKLTFGLLTSFEARDLYENNGSLGMKNDYLVLAEDLLCCNLRSVAMFMFVLALLPLPLGLLIGWWRNRMA